MKAVIAATYTKSFHRRQPERCTATSHSERAVSPFSPPDQITVRVPIDPEQSTFRHSLPIDTVGDYAKNAASNQSKGARQ
jgi:hypothetical protein